MTYEGLNDDFLDLIEAFVARRVRFVIVGAHALAVHGHPRATGDLDILVEPAKGNAVKVMDALRAFGAPVDAHGVTLDDFVNEGTVYQIGLPPRRIDVLTQISGVTFEKAWTTRVEVRLESVGLDIPFLGKKALIDNKRAAGRAKDLLDAELLSSMKKT